MPLSFAGEIGLKLLLFVFLDRRLAIVYDVVVVVGADVVVVNVIAGGSLFDAISEK